MPCMSSCKVWFYNPTAEAVTGANLVNKIVAGVYPPYCHTELQFPNGEACSVVMNSTVRLRTRTYNTDFYTCLVIHADECVIEKALQLARRHVQLQTQFGLSAGCTFCSKLVAELLVESGIVSPQILPDSYFLSPSTLYHRLTQCRQQVTMPVPASTRVLPISFVNPLAQEHEILLCARHCIVKQVKK